MKVTEIFRTVQGEGPFLGVPSTFLRLAGCNLDCPFCDTPFSIKPGPDEYTEMSVAEVRAELLKTPALPVIVTGGEPLLQLEDLCALIFGHLDLSDTVWHVETNGTMTHKLIGLRVQPFQHVVISPKPPPGSRKMVEQANALAASGVNVTLKFLSDGLDDPDLRILAMAAAENVTVCIQPVTDKDALVDAQLSSLRRIVELVRSWDLSREVRVLPRLHTLLWGNERRR